MSRVGKQPIDIPQGVDIRIEEKTIYVKGPKGEISTPRHNEVTIRIDKDSNQLFCERSSDAKKERELHGLVRSLIANMVEGVTKQFQKKLEINGLGYTCQVTDNELTLQVGFSHPVNMKIPDGLDVTCPTNRNITIVGIDKQKVGQFAAEVRGVRPPEPYNTKGIKYDNEIVRRKAGKTFVSGGGG